AATMENRPRRAPKSTRQPWLGSRRGAPRTVSSDTPGIFGFRSSAEFYPNRALVAIAISRLKCFSKVRLRREARLRRSRLNALAASSETELAKRAVQGLARARISFAKACCSSFESQHIGFIHKPGNCLGLDKPAVSWVRRCLLFLLLVRG